jgi:hypothetical protein
LISLNVFSHHFRIFWTWTSPPRETSFLIFFGFLNLDLSTSWNVFSHHFFGFFELWPPVTTFLIIFSDFLIFDLLKRLFSSFFRIFWTLTSWNV